MLRGRLIIAAILALVVLAGVWLLPPKGVALAFGGVALVVAFEWGALAGLRHWYLGLYVVAAAVALASVAWLIGVPQLPLAALLVGAAVVWLIPLARLVGHARGRPGPWPPAVALPLGILLIVGSWLGLVAPLLLGGRGAYWLTAVLVMVWGSDIGGYFAGRALGRHALMASISPSKTWEGCIGGVTLALAAVAALVGGLASLGTFRDTAPWHHLFLVPPVVAAAIAGDLFESLLKREAGVKDSGRILAGHGGALDRLDALLMAAPVYAILSMGTL